MKIHAHTAHEMLAERGPVLLRVLDGEIFGRDHIDRACTILDDMLERYPFAGLLLVIEHGTPLPPLDTLRYVGQRFDPYGDRIVVSVILLGLGFWRASFIRLSTRMGPMDHTVVVEFGVAEGCTALAHELVGVDPDELLGACEALRSTLADAAGEG